MFSLFAVCSNHSFIPQLASIFYCDGEDRIKIKCGSFNIDLQCSADRISIRFYLMESGHNKITQKRSFDIDWGVAAVPDIVLGRASLICGIWISSDFRSPFRFIHPILIRNADSIRQIVYTLEHYEHSDILLNWGGSLIEHNRVLNGVDPSHYVLNNSFFIGHCQ